MNIEEQLNYAVYVLEHNVIKPNEVKYYQGLTGKNPHGIPDEVWVLAAVVAEIEGTNKINS